MANVAEAELGSLFFQVMAEAKIEPLCLVALPTNEVVKMVARLSQFVYGSPAFQWDPLYDSDSDKGLDRPIHRHEIALGQFRLDPQFFCRKRPVRRQQGPEYLFPLLRHAQGARLEKRPDFLLIDQGLFHGKGRSGH